MYTEFERILAAKELALFKKYIQKRIEGFSAAAIIGKKEFMGLTLKVNEQVLIPRPDTETWLEKVIQYYRNETGLKVADLGTGSGAILVGFLYYCRDAVGVGVDISTEALKIAEENGQNLKITDRVVETKVEIQIRTIAMDFWASLEHKIYYKFEGHAPEYISRDLRACAEIVSNLDAKMLQLNEAILEEKEKEEQKKKEE